MTSSSSSAPKIFKRQNVLSTLCVRNQQREIWVFLSCLFHSFITEVSRLRSPPPALAESPYSIYGPTLTDEFVSCASSFSSFGQIQFRKTQASPEILRLFIRWHITLFFKVWCSALNQIVPLWAISPVSDSARPIRCRNSSQCYVTCCRRKITLKIIPSLDLKPCTRLLSIGLKQPHGPEQPYRSFNDLLISQS